MALIDTLKKKPKSKAHKKTEKPDWSYLVELNRALVGRKETRHPGLHVSSLYNVCPKQAMMEKLAPTGKLGPEQFTAGKYMIFDVGKAFHWMCQELHVPLFGLKYQNEVMVRWPEHDIVGEYDTGILAGEPVILEYKSKAEYMYERLKAPDAPHIFQLQMYMHLHNKFGPVLSHTTKEIDGVPTLVATHAADYQKVNWGLFIYFNKNKQDRKGMVDGKEYWMEYDPAVGERVEHRLELLKKAETEPLTIDVAGSNKNHDFMVCREPTDWRARACPHSHECFFGKINEASGQGETK